MSKGPNLGGSGPNLGSSGPNLGKQSTKPDIAVPNKPIIETKSTTKREKSVQKSNQIYFSQFILKWGVLRRKLRRTFVDLMSREMHINVNVATTNALFRDHILELMKGQLNYFDDVIDDIDNERDKLSKQLIKEKVKKKDRKVSKLVFERLKARVIEEIKELEQANIRIMADIEEELKRHQDTRLEPRTGFWTLILSGLILNNIDERLEDEFEILMRVSLEYDNPYKHTLIVFLHFVLYMIRELPPFGKDDAQTNMVINVKKTGYSMAHWIKYRYGTNSQFYMEYDRFVKFYARSFGLIRGRAPKYKREAYFRWIDRTFKALEKTLLSAELFRDLAKGQTIEGIIAGLIDQMEQILDKRKYDEDNKLLNQPLGGEGALNFLKWLLETALNRNNCPNIAIQEDIRLQLEMFDFIPHTIRWVNELNEKLSIDWLGLDDEEEDAGNEEEEEEIKNT